MAFGFGFNKQKVLSAAEKYVQQGKLQNAIAEYEKILKNDPKDLTVTNTVGDLYSRLGETDKATECFKNVGDAYAGQGFTVKAIAMYKKISKLRPSLESVLKLAELYTQQGLFNDARAQYLQVAEEFLKSGELENAVRIFQKILEMDPENTQMRVRLAEVYIRLGKKNEAWQIFSAAAEAMRAKGSLSGCDEILQRMLTLDPGNSYALLLQARNSMENGDAETAIQSLEKVPDLDSKPEGLKDLLKAYLQAGRLSDAGTLANKLMTVHNDLTAIASFADALMQAGQYETALQVYDQHADRLLAENSENVLKNLHMIIGHVRENADSLEKLLALFQKAGETTHISEVTELLAHASVQSGDLPRARDLYQKLATIEPGNPLHLKNYEQVVAQLGGSSGTKLITAEEAAVIVDELEATAPPIHQHYPDEVALAVRSALTDAELFISYNMPAKALGPLMLALPQAPRDLRLNQRLAALHTRAGRFAEAAVCCRTLQNIYSEADLPDEATRYGELGDRYEERSSATIKPLTSDEQEMTVIEAADVPAESAPWPQASEEATVSESAPAEFAVVEEESAAAAETEAPAEIDLSSEWEDTVTVEGDSATAEAAEVEVTDAAAKPEVPAGKVDETIEEVRFYVEHGMPEQAWAALAKLQTQTQDEAKIAELRAEIEAASQQAPAEEATVEPEAEITVEEATAETAEQEFEISVDEAPVAEAEAPAEPQFEVEAPAPEQHAKPGKLKELVSDLESSLGEGFAPGKAARKVEPPAPKPAEIKREPKTDRAHKAVAHTEPAVSAQAKGEVLGEFVSDLENSLGDDFLKQGPAVEKVAAPTPPAAQAPRAASAAAAAGSRVPVPAPQPTIAARQTAPSAPAPKPPVPAAVPTPAPAAAKASPFGEEAGVDLAEMFGELKQDLEADVASADEDPETHYNLGIAFREMGLLDEAIGELQKACQAVDRGRPFPQVMQTYTWLAQCFLDKGVPEASVRWYDKALCVPSIDEETRTALHYELAAAYETAGDKPSALKHFMEVYGRNIDYRDVSERIKALKS